MNLVGAHILGQERAWLLGSRLGFYVDEVQRAEFNDLRVRAQSWREVQASDFLLHIEGHESLLVHASVIWFGDTTGWQIALVDMSERQQMEAQLHASEERLALALTAVGYGVWDWQEGGQSLVNRIIAEVRSNPVLTDGKQIAYTVSVGATCLVTQVTFMDLLAECDKALYCAKISGRDRLEISWQKPAGTG